MKSWKPFIEGPEPWEFLRKVASAITGREVEVHPGGYPTASRVFPHRHLSRVTLPPGWLSPQQEPHLRGALSHELLHVMHSDPEALEGIAWAVYLLANSLEDSRLEFQCETTWPGLVRPVKTLARQVVAFVTRQRQLARDAASSKVYEVAVAIYMLLTGFAETVVARAVNPMAVGIAHEVMDLARPALAAENSAEVVAIAMKIAEELERAAQRAADKANTPAARSYVQTFTHELRQAMQVTVEQVFIRLSATPRPSQWWGPWYRGSGGYSFHPMVWEWETTDAPPPATPDTATLIRWLMEADPHHEVEEVLTHQISGRLAPKSRDLVQAALGKNPRVFTRSHRTQRLVLPHLLATTEFVFLIEAHHWYGASSWNLVLATVISLARLLAFSRSRFAVRAWTVTRPDEEVEDPITKRRFTRPANEFYVHIGTVKGPDEVWGRGHEVKVASLPSQGFNNPLEGYDRAMHWNLNLPAPTSRKRVVVCLGDARRLNLHSGQLQHATPCLRKPNQRAMYVHLGTSIPFFDPMAEELDAQFDGWVQARTVHESVSRTLRRLLLLLAA